MKKISALSLMAFISFFNATLFAQPFTTVWNYALGGNGNDQAYAVAATSDNGTISAGQTNSNNNGDVGPSHGAWDGWIVKQDANGVIVWQKALGGSKDDHLYDVAIDANGFIYAVGYTYSVDGDLATDPSHADYWDMWVVKLDASGNLIKSRTYGGIGADYGLSVAIANDGGIFVCGRGESTDFDLMGCIPNSLWMMKLNAALNISWSKCFYGGGNGPYYNTLNDVQATADGGCITTGGAWTIPGHGSDDAWVAKLDAGGNIQWERSLGGSFSDVGRYVIPTSDGGYLVSIRCGSNDFDGVGHHGNVGSVGDDDVLLVKLDASGNTFWKRCWGGSGTEAIGEIIETPDHNFLSVNGTTSIDGDVLGTGGDSYYNGWVFKVDPLDTLIWQQVVFSISEDVIFLTSATVAPDNSYVINGYGYGNYIPGHHDSNEFYTLKIKEPDIIIPPTQSTWSVAYGGTQLEKPNDVEITSDTGVIVTGRASSNDGDVTGIHEVEIGTPSDYWITKLNRAGELQWQKCLGGTGYDYGYAGKQTSDGGYIVTGDVSRRDGDILCEPGQSTEGKAWTVKLDGQGNITWQYQPCHADYFYGVGVAETAGSEYALSAFAIYNDSVDIIGMPYPWQFWLGKLDNAGNLLWQKSYGGSNIDEPRSMNGTSDGGFIMAGYTSSSDGDVTGYHLGWDALVVKADANGNLQWAKALGGSKNDYANCVKQTSDGGYIVACESESNDGDVSGHHSPAFQETFDYWIVKLNSAGAIVWQKSLGGKAHDKPRSVAQTNDGGYVVAGYTESSDGDVTGRIGARDYWIVKLDANGILLWQKCFGSSSSDEATSITTTQDGLIVVAGTPNANDGNVTGIDGAGNYWIMKFYDCNTTFYEDGDGDGYGNNALSVTDCFLPPGYVLNNLDCNDTHASVHPGNIPDVCNNLDDDCDGVIDENGSYVRYYPDVDADGYGDPGSFIYACSTPEGYVTNNTDCNDANASSHPGACEIYNNDIDEDCDGVADDCNTPSSGFKATKITANSAKVKWDILPCAVGYTVQYRITGSGMWASVKVNENTGVKKLKNLQVNTSYDWQVRTKCNSGPAVYSDYSAIHTFTTLPLRPGSGYADFTNIKLIPNPTDHLVKITCDECHGISEITFYNVLGQKMLNRKVEVSDSFNETIDVSGLPAGLYLVELKGSNGGGTIKLVKE